MRRGTISQSNVSEIFSREIIQVVNGGMRTNNDDNMIYVKELIKKGENIRLSSYANEHVLYFFITNILSDIDNVICKIGYTSNINKRIHSLVNEYDGTMFHLIGVKRIRNVSDEENFHSLLKQRYSQLVYNDITIKTTHKDELYIFDKCIWEEFVGLVEYQPERKALTINDVMNNIMSEYKNGTIDRETLVLMLRVMENNIELEKMRYDNK